MFPKDPKKPAIDAASMMKDEAIKRAMDAAKSQATERIQGDGYTIYKTDGLTSGFDLNDYNPEEVQSALLSKLGLNPNPSGLVFACKIGLLPAGTLQVIDFDLTEGLSSLFSLSINAVSFLPFIDFQAHLGAASSLTVKRDGKIIRTVNGILSGAIQGNTDSVKTWYHFEIRPEMWVMTLNQDSRIFQDQTARPY
ncbi:hypothetical protein M2263_003635 [Providencia alcalifaciens]|nr:hypothetical protein [Providencia alcalifaciens]